MFIEPYRTLRKTLGPSYWWPGDSAFEIMVGAILTQNTSWKNVEKAIHRLKTEKALSPKTMHQVPVSRLAEWIRSSGYFNQKARRLHEFLNWYRQYRYSVSFLLKKHAHQSEPIRNELLSIHGVGPETADSILCYALGLPVFVVDAYTHRWLSRYDVAGWRASAGSYNLLKSMVESEFQRAYPEIERNRHFNEFHALLVRLGNGYCKKTKPLCLECPLTARCQKALT
jgi:endonuclease-3 related protein